MQPNACAMCVRDCLLMSINQVNLYSGRIVLRRKLMRLARLAVVIAAVVAMGSVSLTAQKSPDMENGFKNFGSYDGSHLDTVNLMNGNLILHAPILPGYPQRGKLGIQPVLVFNSKAWQVICTDNFDNLQCGWFHGGTGVTQQFPTDLGIQ